MSFRKFFGCTLLAAGFAGGAEAAVVTPDVHIVSVNGYNGLNGLPPVIGCVDGVMVHEVDVYDGEFSIRFIPGPNNFHLIDPKIATDGSSTCRIRIDLRMPKDTCFTLDAAMILGNTSLDAFSNVSLLPSIQTYSPAWGTAKDLFLADRSLMQVNGPHREDFLNIGELTNADQKSLVSCESSTQLELSLTASIQHPVQQPQSYADATKVRSFEFVFKTRKKLKLEPFPRFPLQ